MNIKEEIILRTRQKIHTYIYIYMCVCDAERHSARSRRIIVSLNDFFSLLSVPLSSFLQIASGRNNKPVVAHARMTSNQFTKGARKTLGQRVSRTNRKISRSLRSRFTLYAANTRESSLSSIPLFSFFFFLFLRILDRGRTEDRSIIRSRARNAADRSRRAEG